MRAEFWRMGSNMVRADFWQQTDLPPGSNKFRMVYENAAGGISWRSNMHGLEYGSCRFLQRTDLPPGSNMHGLKSGSYRFWQRTDSPPGSNMHGLKSGSCRFLQRTDSPPGSNMLRLAYADSGSACKLAGVQISPLPTLANQILARTFFRFRLASVCMPSR